VRIFTPHDIAHALVRRRWLVLLPFAVGVACMPLLAQYAPERFRSETLIMVVPQRVPDSYVKATITESIEARLPSISEQILSRSRLERIITDMNLYGALRARQVMEDVVQAMRSDVTVSLAGGRENSNSFRVSYVSDHPDTARKVTERLASLYIEQNLKDRATQADSTSEFLEAQLQDAKQRLIEHEKKLEAYRRQHAGELPTQLQANLQSIQSASLQLQSLNESMNRALERRLLIERQIADTQALPLPEAPAALPVAQGGAAPTATSQRLTLARLRLSALLQSYTPSHPEVVAAQRAVGELQEALALESPAAGSDAEPVRTASPAAVAQQKRILDLKADLLVVEKQLESSRAEETVLKASIASLQGKVDVLPSRESELVELTRDYGTLQAAYANLLTKREDSVMAANLERRQIGEQFRILDPASLPQKPYNDVQRTAIIVSGAAVGALLGLLLVVFGEVKDSSFRTEDEVMASLSLPVLALIPVMQSEHEARAQRRRRRLVDAAGAAALAAAVLVVVIWRWQS
jgi:polysaccharide chain length determinant protein (PEP-CTERM system associated)